MQESKQGHATASIHLQVRAGPGCIGFHPTLTPPPLPSRKAAVARHPMLAVLSPMRRRKVIEAMREIRVSACPSPWIGRGGASFASLQAVALPF
ncbi:MAG: hypothetical protein SGPRY_013568 [Prymnesium sp.]